MKLLYILFLCLSLLLSGCGKDCDHQFVHTSSKEPSCVLPGILEETCTLCKTLRETVIPETGHSFALYSAEPCVCTRCGEYVEGAAADPSHPWYGKTWLALGTSLTSPEFGRYVEPLAERSGLIPSNLGIPGACAHDLILHLARTSGDLKKAHLITVEFGVNDWNQNIPLGIPGDTVPYLYQTEDWHNDGSPRGTYAGACYQVFHALLENAPGARIVFLTDPAGNWEESLRTDKNKLGLTQRQYAETAMAAAQRMGIPVIDAGGTAQIGQEHPEYYTDHIHHTDLGGRQYALTVWMELKDIAPLLTGVG